MLGAEMPEIPGWSGCSTIHWLRMNGGEVFLHRVLAVHVDNAVTRDTWDVILPWTCTVKCTDDTVLLCLGFDVCSCIGVDLHTPMVLCCSADFFHSSLSTHFAIVVGFICLVYTATFFLFGVLWWAELA